MSRRPFLTPATLPAGVTCRTLIIPNSREWLGIINSAILELTRSYNYQQINDTDLTPDEVSAYWISAYADWLASECGSTLVCEIPSDPGAGIDTPQPPMRLGISGAYQQLIDGEWKEPEGDYQPQPPANRAESTCAQRQCAASVNAAHVMSLIYEEITDAWAVEKTKIAIAQAIFDAVATFIAPWAGAGAAAGIAYANTAIDLFVESMDALTTDVWTAGFTDEYACFLQRYSVCVGPRVEFDWPGMQWGFQTAASTALIQNQYEKALLWGQLAYLHQMLGADAINFAGGTTAITSPSCSCTGAVILYPDAAFSGGKRGACGTGVITGTTRNSPTPKANEAWIAYQLPFSTVVRKVTVNFTKVNGTWTSPATFADQLALGSQQFTNYSGDTLLLSTQSDLNTSSPWVWEGTAFCPRYVQLHMLAAVFTSTGSFGSLSIGQVVIETDMGVYTFNGCTPV